VASLKEVFNKNYKHLAYLLFKFPKCASLSSFAATKCLNATSLVLFSGFSSQAICTVANNTVRVENVLDDYNKSNSSLWQLGVSLTTSHTCQDNDYLIVAAIEPYKKNLVEKAVVSL
jgi:hypothetical protein